MNSPALQECQIKVIQSQSIRAELFFLETPFERAPAAQIAQVVSDTRFAYTLSNKNNGVSSFPEPIILSFCVSNSKKATTALRKYQQKGNEKLLFDSLSSCFSFIYAAPSITTCASAHEKNNLTKRLLIFVRQLRLFNRLRQCAFYAQCPIYISVSSSGVHFTIFLW